MVQLFYVDGCLRFSHSKDKIDDVYASLQEDPRIEYYGQLNRYIL